MDDARRLAGRNGQPASGRVLRDAIQALDAIATRPRPLFTWQGGATDVNTSQSVPSIRHRWLDASPGRCGVAAVVYKLPTLGTPVTGQGATLGITGAYANTTQAAEPARNANPFNVPLFPFNAKETSPLVFTVPTGSATRPRGLVISSDTANGPQIRAGMIFERNNVLPGTSPATNPQYLTDDWQQAGQQITGRDTANSDLRSLRSYRNYLRAAYKGRRLHFGWSAGNPDGGGVLSRVSQIATSTYSYILDPTVTSPTVNGPGICVPLRYSASGIGTRIRLYVSVYAAVTGGTGTFGYYNLNDFGAIQGPTALNNSPSVTSGTFAWYGISDPFAESTDAYMFGNATLAFDKIILCGRCTGGTLKVGAFAIHSYHSQR
jgi:hypothetical protein